MNKYICLHLSITTLLVNIPGHSLMRFLLFTDGRFVYSRGMLE